MVRLEALSVCDRQLFVQLVRAELRLGFLFGKGKETKKETRASCASYLSGIYSQQKR